MRVERGIYRGVGGRQENKFEAKGRRKGEETYPFSKELLTTWAADGHRA